MSLIKYIKSLIASGTGNSIKSFSLFVSIIAGFLISLAIVFVLIYDVVNNNHVETDLYQLGFFLMCVGIYITGSSTPKIFGEKFSAVKESSD